MRMEINFVLGKNGGRRSSSLGCRLIIVGRRAGRQTICLQFTKFLNFDNFHCKGLLGCLNRFMAPIRSFVSIDKHPVFEGNIIVRQVFHTQEAIYSMSIPTIKYHQT